MNFKSLKLIVKPALSGLSKEDHKLKPIGFQDRLQLNADQKYCRMPPPPP